MTKTLTLMTPGLGGDLIRATAKYQELKGKDPSGSAEPAQSRSADAASRREDAEPEIRSLISGMLDRERADDAAAASSSGRA